MSDLALPEPKQETCKITFLPSGKTAEVPRGTLLLDAAGQVGLLIDTPCGGQGRCGRCQVKVDQGRVSRRENPHLTPAQIKEGWVLSCVARAESDVTLTVPAESERTRIATETAASRKAPSISCDWPLYPDVRQISLELTPPSLEDATADFERLRMAVQAETGVDALKIELPVLQKLASTLREKDWQVTAVLEMGNRKNEARLVDIWAGKRRRPMLGVAVDIGTTNVVVDLMDLRSGRFIERASNRNQQRQRGEDVISRTVYSERGKGLDELQQLVITTINELLDELARKQNFKPADVCEMVVAGNTIMTHLFLGLPPRQMRLEPYIPTAKQFPVVTAASLGIHINPGASVYCAPAIAAYVGGDTTAGVIASCMYLADKLTLFLDVGTNGEIVLGNKDWMTTCACSAGPAFEGAGVKQGMRAVEGAIEDVKINSKTLEPTLGVIGKATPRGICGSGMISALAEMFLTGVIDRAGRMNVESVGQKMGAATRARKGDHGGEYVLAWAKDSAIGEDVVITEVDIDNLIRTKSSIYAGIAVMARSLGIALSDIEEVLIGGAFGQHINVENAIQIGLLPDLPWDRFRYLGNTSAWGAEMVLISRQARAKAEEVADKMTYFELVADNSFMGEFSAGLFLPHTELSRFPSVQAMLQERR